MTDLDASVLGWDSIIQGNTEKVFKGPFPVFQHTGDESDLETIHPAAANDRCIIMVNHSIDGWTLYFSTGSAWNPV